MRLNLSNWIWVREKDVGPYSDYIIRETGAYEDHIKELMEVLESTTYALEMLLPYAKGLPLYRGACEDHKRALEVICNTKDTPPQ